MVQIFITGNYYFKAYYALNDLQSALKWLNIMLLESNNKEIKQIAIFSKLIELCCKNNDFREALNYLNG